MCLQGKTLKVIEGQGLCLVSHALICCLPVYYCPIASTTVLSLKETHKNALNPQKMSPSFTHI